MTKIEKFEKWFTSEMIQVNIIKFAYNLNLSATLAKKLKILKKFDFLFKNFFSFKVAKKPISKFYISSWKMMKKRRTLVINNQEQKFSTHCI